MRRIRGAGNRQKLLGQLLFLFFQLGQGIVQVDAVQIQVVVNPQGFARLLAGRCRLFCGCDCGCRRRGCWRGRFGTGRWRPWRGWGAGAHDFNNLLTAIIGNANLVQMDLPKGSPLHAPLEEIEQASARAANLCRQMMAYAGTGPHRFEALDLSRLLKEVEPLLSVSLGKSIQLEMELAQPLPAIRADAMQLRQVALNLVVNAVEAIEPKAGVIRMSTREVALTTAELRQRFHAPDLVGGRYVVWEVCDTGCGMSPEVRAHACEPFFTTKFTGQGLGLAAVHGIVRSHHGALQVESAEGAGCTLSLVFPVLVARG